MHYVLRVSLPDRPGSLHALTGACRAAGADIVSLDVIERSSGFAVDDLCVMVGNPSVLTASIDHLPGTAVMSMRQVASFRDMDGALALAAAMVAEGRGAVRLLVDRLPEALWAGWAIGVARGWNGLEVLAASKGAVVPEASHWLPLIAPRRLHRSDVVVDHSVTVFDGLELVAAPLGQTTSAIIVARRGGPRFVDRELRQLDLLAKVAVATEVAHTTRRPIERIEPARRTIVRS
jgi:ACT domain